MSIRFQCEKCGHPFDVDDRFEGKHGRCKHCGHVMIITAHRAEPARNGAPLRLRPLEGDAAEGAHAHLLAPQAPLKVRPAQAEPRVKPAAISDVDEPIPTRRRGPEDYNVLDPHGLTRTHSPAGPPPRWTMLPSLTARFVAGYLRSIRDWLYVISIAFLVVSLLGYLFKWKLVLHLGALGVIATNVGMLGFGLAYLVTLPFKESLAHGLANVLVPFYAIYYWATRWNRMKTPVYRTLGSFLPIALVGMAIFAYKEAPRVEKVIERELPKLERRLERRVPGLEKTVNRALKPLEERVGPLPERARETDERPIP